MTQSGKISCPSPKINKWPLCTAESLPKTPFLWFWPKPSKAEKSQNLEEEEGRQGGGGQECVGEGAEISLCATRKKSTIFISLFFFQLISENILSFPHEF